MTTIGKAGAVDDGLEVAVMDVTITTVGSGAERGGGCGGGVDGGGGVCRSSELEKDDEAAGLGDHHGEG